MEEDFFLNARVTTMENIIPGSSQLGAGVLDLGLLLRRRIFISLAEMIFLEMDATDG